MRRKAIALIVFGCLVLLAILQLRGKSPILPGSSKTMTISLYEPYSENLIVEKTISDQGTIEELTRTLSRAKSCSDHKCASIGEISFLSSSGVKVLKLLPGHNSAKYEFRFEGNIFSLSRKTYIDALVAAGIDRNDIRLDGHPEFEPGTSDN